MAVVFAVALWAFVVTEERTDAVFTVPLDLVDRPAGVEVASVGVETVVVRVEGRRQPACGVSTRRTSGRR